MKEKIKKGALITLASLGGTAYFWAMTVVFLIVTGG